MPPLSQTHSSLPGSSLKNKCRLQPSLERSCAFLRRCKLGGCRDFIKRPAATVDQSQHCPDTPTCVRIPEAVGQRLRESHRQWSQHCKATPLTNEEKNCSVHLLGFCHFSPPPSTDYLAETLDHLKPAAVLLDLPPQSLPEIDANARSAAAPARPVIPVRLVQLLLEHQQIGHNRGSASSGSSSASSPSTSHTRPASPSATTIFSNPASRSPADATSIGGLQLTPESQDEIRLNLAAVALLQAIADSATAARVGRDIVDPYEVFGFYPATDAVISPQQAIRVLQLFGYMPGAEFAACVSWAMKANSSVACIDAPLKLQEAWVASLLKEFILREADLPRQLQRELQSTQAMVPHDLILFESILAEAFAPSSATATAAAAAAAAATASDLQPTQISTSSSASSETTGVESETGSIHAGSSGSDLLVGFKVSRAMAAAVLDPVATAEAVSLQSKLQPLKFQHFSKRALYMARRIREVSEGLQQNREFKAYSASISSRDAMAAGTVTDKGSEASLEQVLGVTDKDPLVIVAVVGRQYVAEIQRLWTDKNSSLWRSSVPRTFAPSTVIVDDPDVNHGGSRPVGQRSKTIGEYTNKQ